MAIPLRRYRELVAAYLRPELPRLGLLALLLFTNAGLQVISPLLLRRFLDAATAGEPTRSLSRIALIFIGVAVGTQVVALLETYLATDVGWSATNRLRSDLAEHCLRLDMTFHTSHLPGDLIQRLDYDVGTLANLLSRFLLQVLASLLLLVGVLAVLLRIDWRVGLSFLAFVAVALVVLNRIRKLATPYAQADLQSMSALYGYLEERLAGTEDLRSRGATSYALRGLYSHMRERLRARRAAGAVFAFLLGSMSLVSALGTALAYGLGGYLFHTGALTIGTVYALVAYLALVARPLSQLTEQAQDLQQATAGISRIEQLFGTTSRIQDGPGATIPAGPLAVELRAVSFGYGGGEVLSGISLSLPPGAVLGVLGRTGSGKTTLTRLLLRLYDPTAGSVRLGGVDLDTACQEEIRERVGLVTQEVQLFHASVRDNLSFFNRAISDDRILSVLESLGLWPWYRTLPNGLDTELGGGTLSAGEAQMLAFARVFLKDPGLVILDEATSRLDPVTELCVERAVDLLLRDRTGIIVAHRLATVERADTILILEEGRIAELGDRGRIAADPDSLYARLLRTGLEVPA